MAYLVPPTFSVTMVDGSLSGRISPLCAGDSIVGVPRPRRIGVAIPQQGRETWGGPPPRCALAGAVQAPVVTSVEDQDEQC